MPRFDRTGPEGQGSQTGRKMGKCNPQKSKAKTSDDELPNGRGLANRPRFGKRNGFWRGISKNDNI